MEEIYPKDWKEYKFGDVFDLGGSLSISRANLSDEGICYLHYGDIHKSSDSFIDVNKSYEEIPKYNIALEEVDSKYLLKDGDIVFADASEDYEGIAKSLTVVNTDSKPFISGLHTIVARDKCDLIDNIYKRYFLKEWEIRKQLMTLATGTSVLGISQPNLKKIKVFLPPKEEQNKIGLILSKWDIAIELKEKLIAQKKEQKKGLMQRLLLKKSNIKESFNEWKEFYIKDVCKVVSGGTPSTDDRESWNGDIQWCTPTDITSSGRYIKTTKQTISEKGLKNSSANLLPANSILMCSRATIGPRAINKVEMATNQGFKSFVCDNNKLHYEFFYYLLSVYIPYFKKLASGSTFLEISKKDVENTKILIPVDLSEQKRIAEILSSIDLNIELLEIEKQMYKEQKQALMQQLLTGKIRVKV